MDISAVYYSYRDPEGSLRHVWFEDAKSIQEKIDMLKELGVDQFVFWRIGGEDPRIYVAD